jgi:hypothetical protein
MWVLNTVRWELVIMRSSSLIGRGDPLLWSHDTLYPQELSLTPPISGGRSIGIVRSRTKATQFFRWFLTVWCRILFNRCWQNEHNWIYLWSRALLERSKVIIWFVSILCKHRDINQTLHRVPHYVVSIALSSTFKCVLTTLKIFHGDTCRVCCDVVMHMSFSHSDSALFSGWLLKQQL